jgi:hypothetical protein
MAFPLQGWPRKTRKEHGKCASTAREETTKITKGAKRLQNPRKASESHTFFVVLVSFVVFVFKQAVRPRAGLARFAPSVLFPCFPWPKS